MHLGAARASRGGARVEGRRGEGQRARPGRGACVEGRRTQPHQLGVFVRRAFIDDSDFNNNCADPKPYRKWGCVRLPLNRKAGSRRTLVPLQFADCQHPAARHLAEQRWPDTNDFRLPQSLACNMIQS